MKFVLATHNRHKVTEMNDILKETFAQNGIDSDIELLTADDIGCTDEPEENGTTFKENAMIKAKSISGLGYISIADDSGLSVDALDGEPGVHSARYSGGDDSDNIRLLLSRLEGVADERRTARFISAICCIMPDGHVIETMGECNGTILHQPIGVGGFGYDPVFFYPPLEKTLAELTPSEKNSVSHRRRALENFSKMFAEYLTENDLAEVSGK